MIIKVVRYLETMTLTVFGIFFSFLLLHPYNQSEYREYKLDLIIIKVNEYDSFRKRKKKQPVLRS